MGMLGDFARLVLGLIMAAFHRPIANFIMDREQALLSFFHRHGVHFPDPPSEATLHNIYFGLGLFSPLFSIVRSSSLLFTAGLVLRLLLSRRTRRREHVDL